MNKARRPTDADRNKEIESAEHLKKIVALCSIKVLCPWTKETTVLTCLKRLSEEPFILYANRSNLEIIRSI